MTREQIRADYREDWFLRNAGGLAPGKREPVRVLGASPDPALDACLRKVLAGHGHAAAPEGAEGPAVAWDLGGARLSGAERAAVLKDGNTVLVTDGSELPPDFAAAVLRTGRLYGAGLDTEDNEAGETGCTNVLDLIGGILFLLDHPAQTAGRAWYAGHGPAEGAEDLGNLGYERKISAEDGRYMLGFLREHPDERFWFRNSLGGVLPRLQDALRELLEETDRVCREHGIRYFLAGGTLLGAVRHGGFVPWDDDMDLMMLREDYDRFLELGPEAFGGRFFFQTSGTDPQYHSPFCKIRLNGTEFVTRFSDRCPGMHQGIFLDVFSHDRTAPGKTGRKLHLFFTLLARSMVFHKWEGTPLHFYGKLKAVCAVFTRIMERTPMEKLEARQDRIIRRFRGRKTGWLYDGMGDHVRNGAFPEEWLSGTEYLPFEGREYPVPVGYDAYLRYLYGDYEKWPAASLRKSGHDIIRVSFGDGEET